MRLHRPDHRRPTALLLAGILAMSGLAQAPAMAVAQDGTAALEGTDWQLTQLATDGVLAPVADGVTPTMLLEDGAASGSAGCNQWFATYTLDGDSLSFAAPGTTLMLCPEPAASVETAFLADLALVDAWAIDGTTLTLLDASAAPILEYTAVAASPVVGSWIVSVYADGTGVVVPPLPGSELSAVFGADGSLSGSSGCNRFAGSYTSDGDALEIGPLASTAMACADEPLAAQEADYLAALQASVSATLGRTSLQLFDAEGRHHRDPQPRGPRPIPGRLGGHGHRQRRRGDRLAGRRHAAHRELRGHRQPGWLDGLQHVLRDVHRRR